MGQKRTESTATRQKTFATPPVLSAWSLTRSGAVVVFYSWQVVYGVASINASGGRSHERSEGGLWRLGGGGGETSGLTASHGFTMIRPAW